MAPAAQPAVYPPLGPQGPGPVGPRPPRAAHAQRAGQEGRRRAQRARPGREHLLQGRLRLHRPGRPARPVALVGPLHPAQARHRRRQDRDPRAARAGRRVLHAAGPHRRRPAHAPSSCGSSPRSRTEFARDTADVTDRQNVQLHWIRIEDVPEIWRRLEAVGLSTTEACGDTPRVILGSPVAGIAADEIIDGDPGDRGDPRALHRRRRSSPTCRASSRPRSAARRCRTSSTRSTTSRSSASCTPSTARASTCGSAAACRPTRCWPSGSAPGCRWTRCPRSGPASSASSGTTATGGCAPGPGSSSWSPTGASRSSAEVLEEEYLGRALVDGPAPPVPYGVARPRRRAPAERRPLLRRTGADRRPGLRHDAGPARRRRRGARVAAGADHAAPEAGRARRGGRPGRLPGRRRRRARAAGQAGHLPAQHDGVHRHRVLQAGDRRDQGSRRPS